MPMNAKQFHAFKARMQAQGKNWDDRTNSSKRKATNVPQMPKQKRSETVSKGLKQYHNNPEFKAFVEDNAHPDLVNFLDDDHYFGQLPTENYGDNTRPMNRQNDYTSAKLDELDNIFHQFSKQNPQQQHGATGGKLVVHDNIPTGIRRPKPNSTSDGNDESNRTTVESNKNILYAYPGLRDDEGCLDLYDIPVETDETQTTRTDENLGSQESLHTPTRSIHEQRDGRKTNKQIPYLQLVGALRNGRRGRLGGYYTQFGMQTIIQVAEIGKTILCTEDINYTSQKQEITEMAAIHLNPKLYSTDFHKRQVNLFHNNCYCFVIVPASSKHGKAIKLDSMAAALPIMDTDTIDNWIVTSEVNEEGMYHFHALINSQQRIDSLKRSLDARFATWGIVTHSSSQTLRQTFWQFLRYITKNFNMEYFQMASNNKIWLDAANHLINTPAEIWIHQPTKPKGATAQITEDIIRIMNKHKVTTTKELMDKSPTTMKKYLHRTGLEAIVNNCNQYLNKMASPQEISDTYEMAYKNYYGYWLVNLILLFQNIDPVQFRIDFTNWIFQKDNKKNTFIIVGPSNSGKSAFIRPLISLFQYGEVVNGGNFMFQDTVGKQMIVWEEPLIPSDKADECKLLMEGSTHKVNIKNKGHEMVGRIPVMITTNKNIWHYCSNEIDAFKNRSYIYRFDKSIDNSKLLQYAQDYINDNVKQNTTSCKGHFYDMPNPRTERSGDNSRKYGQVANTRSSAWYIPNFGCRNCFGNIIRGDDNERSSSCEFTNWYRTNFPGSQFGSESAIGNRDGSPASDRSSNTDDGIRSDGSGNNNITANSTKLPRGSDGNNDRKSSDGRRDAISNERIREDRELDSGIETTPRVQPMAPRLRARRKISLSYT